MENFLSNLSVTTVANEVFSGEDHAILANMIWRRWGRDYQAAHAAWKRLFQNSCTLEDFVRLVDAG